MKRNVGIVLHIEEIFALKLAILRLTPL
jgi:hypothetical protein